MATISIAHHTTRSDHFAVARREPQEVAALPGQVECPQASVVVTSYNHRRYALDLLNALARQESVAFEVVIVDNGSTDGSFAALVKRATTLGLAGRIIRLPRNRGRGVGRNVGILHARAEIIAITDADCLPTPGWLRAGIAGFTGPDIGIVQGRMRPAPHQPQPFFNHFIEIEHFDGTFSTCNALYRRAALEAAGGFASDIYWEDIDLGWRTVRAGWRGVFAPAALVYHQVIPLSPLRWLQWPLLFWHMPAKVARYPEYGRFMFLGVWVHWFHALFDLAVLAVPLAAFVHRAFSLLALPYVVAFPFRHGLGGRWPPVKAAFHLAWDVMACCVLLVSSLRHRRLVL